MIILFIVAAVWYPIYLSFQQRIVYLMKIFYCELTDFGLSLPIFSVSNRFFFLKQRFSDIR